MGIRYHCDWPDIVIATTDLTASQRQTLSRRDRAPLGRSDSYNEVM